MALQAQGQQLSVIKTSLGREGRSGEFIEGLHKAYKDLASGYIPGIIIMGLCMVPLGNCALVAALDFPKCYILQEGCSIQSYINGLCKKQLRL